MSDAFVQERMRKMAEQYRTLSPEPTSGNFVRQRWEIPGGGVLELTAATGTNPFPTGLLDLLAEVTTVVTEHPVMRSEA